MANGVDPRGSQCSHYRVDGFCIQIKQKTLYHLKRIIKTTQISNKKISNSVLDIFRKTKTRTTHKQAQVFLPHSVHHTFVGVSCKASALLKSYDR